MADLSHASCVERRKRLREVIEHATPPTDQKRTGLTQGGRSSEVLGGLPGAQPPTLPLTRSQNVGAVTLSSLSVRIRKTGMSTASSSKVAESE